MTEKRPPRERYDLTIKLHEVDALVAQGYTITAATKATGVSVSTYQKHRSGSRKSVDVDTARQQYAEQFTPYGRAVLNIQAAA